MTEHERDQLMVTLMDIVGEMGIDTDLDWQGVATDVYGSMQHIAAGVVELYDSWQSMPSQERELVMLSVMAKLSLENFLLNLHKMAGQNLPIRLPD